MVDVQMNIGKYIVPFDERNSVLEIKSTYFQDHSGITWYQCEYVGSESIRGFNVASEMDKYAIFDTLQESKKIANMSFGQFVVEYIQSNKAIERLCRKNINAGAVSHKGE